MHSKDKTLIASLAWGDRDKEDRTHYLACRYISEARQHYAIATMFLERFSGSLRVESVELEKATLEMVISKGANQYKQTIGFIDVFLQHLFNVRWPGELINTRHRPVEIGPDKIKSERCHVCVEVKIKEVGIDSILRQISLYRGHFPEYYFPIEWLLVTAFPIESSDMEILRDHKISHLKLGQRFAEYSARVNPEGDSPEL